MSNNSYNGWSNRETWLVNLWLGDFFFQLAENSREFDGKSPEIADFAYQIEEFINEMVWTKVDNDSGLLQDLINDSLSNIDYYELAQATLENLDIEEE